MYDLLLILVIIVTSLVFCFCTFCFYFSNQLPVISANDVVDFHHFLGNFIWKF